MYTMTETHRRPFETSRRGPAVALLLALLFVVIAPAGARAATGDELELQLADPPELQIADPPELHITDVPTETVAPPSELGSLPRVPIDPSDLPVVPEAEPTDPPVGIEVDPDDITTPKIPLNVDVEASCNPDGFNYELEHPSAPDDAVYYAAWRSGPGAEPHPLGAGSQSGFVAVGNGTYQVAGLVVVDGTPFAKSAWTDVVVACRGLKNPQPNPPRVEIDVTPQCLPDEGIEYAITVNGTVNGEVAYKAQWREASDATVYSVDGKEGFIPTGEGTYEVRAVLHKQGPGFYVTDFTDVVVDCPDEPGDTPDDTPRPGTPTFTG